MAFDLPTIHNRVVSLDIHSRQITACALIVEENTIRRLIHQQFGTFKCELDEMVQWIQELRPDAVSMESTGIYWKAPYNALEKAGIIPIVVNPRHVKNLKGHKTDVSDSHRLALLTRADLLRGSFVPPKKMRDLRMLSRQRKKYVDQLVSLKNRLHSILTEIGVRIGTVVSDIHGKSARAMIKAIIDGKEPEVVIRLASNRLKASKEELFDAVQGDMTPWHKFVLTDLMQRIEQAEAGIAQYEKKLLEGLEEERPYLEILQTIPGIDRVGAAMLLVEIGTDMSVFGKDDRLAMWVGLCPGNNESAGKRKSGRTTKGNRHARSLLVEFAHAASRTASVFKTKFQSLRGRIGFKRAIVATAHKLLRTIFAVLKNRVVYRDSSVNYEALLAKRNAPRWIRELKKAGYLDKIVEDYLREKDAETFREKDAETFREKEGTHDRKKVGARF